MADGTTTDGQLLIQLDYGTIVSMLTARADHHEKRAKDHLDEAEALEQRAKDTANLAETVTDRIKASNSTAYDQRNAQSERERAATRLRQAARLRFIVEHLPSEPFFRITVAEATALELIQ